MVRIKRRYIVLRIVHENRITISQETFMKELRDRIADIYGDFGVACLNRGFSVKRYDPKDGYMIIAVRRGVHDMVMSVTPLITSIDRVRSNVNLVYLSGTIRGCLKQLRINYLRNVRQAIAAKTKKVIKMEVDCQE